MLSGNNDSIDAGGHAVGAVFHGNLALAVRAEPRQKAGLACVGQRLGEIVRVGNGRGHEFLRLCAGKTEHHALIACAGRTVVIRIVNAHGDIRGLPPHGDHDIAAVAVKAHLGAVIACVADGLAGDLGDVDAGGRGDLAHDEHHAGRRRRLAGDAAHGVLLEHGVEYAVGDKVAQLIGMSLCNGL